MDNGGIVNRREFMAGAAAVAAGSVALPRLAAAQTTVPVPYDWSAYPPLELGQRQAYIDWMVANRGEDPYYLGLHWDRYEPRP